MYSISSVLEFVDVFSKLLCMRALIQWISSLRQWKRFNFTNSILRPFFLQIKNNEDEECTTLLNSFQNSYRLRIFKKVLENDDNIQSFLEFDECYLLADNYLIAMVFIYFIRSELRETCYDAKHFFGALYLAHEMDEDLEELKTMIVPWFPGTSHYEKQIALNRIKFSLWENMNLDCLVRRKECEWVMNEIQDWSVWKRARNITHHANSIRGRVFKRCCASILQKCLYLNSESYVIEDDIVFQTSDWETDSNPFSPIRSTA